MSTIKGNDLRTINQWNAGHIDGTYDGHQDINNPARYDYLAGLLRDADSVLDVGCGDGLLYSYLQPDHYYGIDACKVAIEKARTRIGKTGIFSCTDAAYWKPWGTFDAVVLNEMIYYIEDQTAFFNKYLKITKPGGLLVVSIFEKKGRFRKTPNQKSIELLRSFKPDQNIQIVENGRTRTIMVFRR